MVIRFCIYCRSCNRNHCYSAPVLGVRFRVFYWLGSFVVIQERAIRISYNNYCIKHELLWLLSVLFYRLLWLISCLRSATSRFEPPILILYQRNPSAFKSVNRNLQPIEIYVDEIHCSQERETSLLHIHNYLRLEQLWW